MPFSLIALVIHITRDQNYTKSKTNHFHGNAAIVDFLRLNAGRRAKGNPLAQDIKFYMIYLLFNN